METWPATLPLPDAVSYSHVPEDVNLRTQMEQGPDRVRPTSTITTATQVPQQWTLTGAQYQTFLTFFHTTLHNGADWFTGSIFRTTGYASKTTRFVGVYRMQYLGHEMLVVSAVLEVQGSLES